MNKNLKLSKERYQQIVAVITLLMVILGIRLFVVTILQHDRCTEEAVDQNTKDILTYAPRGNIYDRNGEVLAENKQTFAVNFNASSLSTEEINQSALALMNTLRENGDKYTDNFPIKITSDGEFYYTYKEQIRKWLSGQGFRTDMTAPEAFSALCARYGLPSDKEHRVASMETIQQTYNLNPPISVRYMTYTYDQELNGFLAKFGIYDDEDLKKGISAEKCFRDLRKNYKISKKLSDEDARKIFILRNEIATNGFTRYLPIKAASGISKKTIAYIEEAGIPGVSISSESERYYPNGKTACHILGYMGAISESEVEHYVEKKGYSASDLVGKDGIEAALEEELHGKAGVKKIQVNSGGEYVKTVKETPAKKGSDVYLTIDLDLQKVMEESLADAVSSAGASQSGAAVVLDVKSADVLAMASYPTFDPNIFAGGISDKAWESVQAENTRDPFAPAPLYNNATQASIQPGSTFKPVTSMAALEKGLDPYRQIYDRGVIEYGGRNFGCSAWNDYGGNHGSENLEWGIGNSCNYYFFCIATGKDWGTGASLGYDITVDDIMQTAKKFGLGEATGIEISESVIPVATANYKMELQAISLRDYLYNNAHTFFPKEVVNDYDKLVDNLATISGWMKDNPEYDELIDLLDKNTDVKKSQLEEVAARVKFDYFIQAQWGVGDQFNTSIGQGFNAYTPVQMANYVATLGNGGVKNQVSLVSGVSGKGTTVKRPAVDVGFSDTNIEEVIKGMKRVCSSGTLSGVLGNLSVEVAGKTGTAENQSLRQPKSEIAYVRDHLGSLNASAGSAVSWSDVERMMDALMDEDKERYPSKEDTVDDALIKASNYKISQSMINAYKDEHDYFAWTIAMAPADDPEIAIVVMLVDGGYSFNAAPVVKDLINAYLQQDKADNTKVNKTEMNGKNEMQ